jgi:hypothetical protein
MRKTILVALALFLIVPAIFGQPEHPGRAARRMLADDDDGRVEVWRNGDAAITTAGESSIRQPLLQVIFAGAGWQPSAKAAMTDLLSRIAMPDGVKPAAIIGTRELAIGDSVNDLAIQSTIDRAMRDGSLPARDENVIYVVLLAPRVRSTLGAFSPGADYDSYHSHLHAHDTNVRYVVVPWHEDSALQREAAMNSTVRAVLNPDSD